MNKDTRTLLFKIDKSRKKLFASIIERQKLDIEMSEGLLEMTNDIEFEYDMSFRKNVSINFIFYPLQFFIRISDAISLKSIILKKSIIQSLEKNDLISSSILIRSNFELMVLYIYFLDKMLTYLKTNNIKGMHKLLSRLYFGKVKKEDKDNMLNENIINFFGKEYLNLNKRFHLGDMITHVSRIKKESFASNFNNTKILENPLFFGTKKFHEKLLSEFDKNECIQDIYDVLSEYVHPTSFRMIENISKKKIIKREKNIEDISVTKNYNSYDFYDEEVFLEKLSDSADWLSLDSLNLYSLYIYMNFYDKFKTDKKLVDNALGIRVITDNKKVYKIENINTGKNIEMYKQ